jgi:two-component system chemotaxis sensor kinase CheA
MVDVLLESTDALCALLARHQGHNSEAPPTDTLVGRIRALVNGQDVGAVASAPAAPAARHLLITVGPVDRADIPAVVGELFRDIPGLGTLETLPDQGDRIHRFEARSGASDEEIFDLFSFHVARDLVQSNR